MDWLAALISAVASGSTPGGFGVGADIDWQVEATLEYKVNDSFALQAGYRYLAVDYDDDGFVWDVSMQGPVIGAKFQF